MFEPESPGRCCLRKWICGIQWLTGRWCTGWRKWGKKINPCGRPFDWVLQELTSSPKCTLKRLPHKSSFVRWTNQYGIFCSVSLRGQCATPYHMRPSGRETVADFNWYWMPCSIYVARVATWSQCSGSVSPRLWQLARFFLVVQSPGWRNSSIYNHCCHIILNIQRLCPSQQLLQRLHWLSG